ncbi:MAG: hypothetical protein EAZ73_07220 [Oscillatoriales cyanobacterium]|nr:MAG: hypothetical protein EAZ83_03655 [Oscillatoriales cyanobacterium]TAF21997.1 MAG: hypothetical protein EAZ73_07220 [Oscillatoriales cyanobacterium]TAF24776.1 MAG: hypothetical protein EAZ69_30470 [Oscillatoriales cyanobacterium]
MSRKLYCLVSPKKLLFAVKFETSYTICDLRVRMTDDNGLEYGASRSSFGEGTDGEARSKDKF